MELQLIPTLYQIIIQSQSILGLQTVWIVGSSLIRRAAEHTRNRPTGRNLELERYGVQIVWVGMSKMRWSHLTSLIQGLLNLYGFPSAVLVHCGGNDNGHTETPCGLLTYQIKVTFVSLFIEILPGCPIIWSSILPRIKWRLSKNNKNGKNKEENQPSCQILLSEQKLLCHKISRF